MVRSANESRDYSNNQYNNDGATPAVVPIPGATRRPTRAAAMVWKKSRTPSHTVPDRVSGFLTISGPGGEVDK